MCSTALIMSDVSSTAAQQIKTRVMNVLDAGSYQMDRFLKFVEIQVDELSQTACVEAGLEPRLHLNPKFIEQHCKLDEHLFMLVMHELYHVLLGHTRLFPRLTNNHNIAFDAYINAQLCRRFNQGRYWAFFADLYEGQAFPATLLCPPKYWYSALSGSPQIREGLTREEELIHRLYYDDNEVTYQEILSLLEESECGSTPVFLIGDHGPGALPLPSADDVPELSKATIGDTSTIEDYPENSEETSVPEYVCDADAGALRSDILKEILTSTVSNWPFCKRSRSLSDCISREFLPKPLSPRKAFLLALRRLLLRAGLGRHDRNVSFAWQAQQCSRETSSVLPNWADRHASSREALLGVAPVIYSSSRQEVRARWTPQEVAHVYLDISGSMSSDLPWLVGALHPLHKKGACRLFVFSTVVDEVRRGRLLTDKHKNTGGTDINCVYTHIVSFTKNRTPRRVVVLSDGYTGVPHPDLASEFKARGISMFVGLVGPGAANCLEPYARHIQRLPCPA